MAIGWRSVLLPWRRPAGLALGALLSAVLGYGVSAAWFQDDAPRQPILFSHRLHAGDHQIPCQYCHIHAERSPAAGVPPVSKCVGCHQVVAHERPAIQTLFGYWQRQQPIPWVKVHDLPDFVHFPHKRHIAAGISCQSCHGAVQTMKVLTRVSPLTMGWCQDCHRQRAVHNGLDCWTCHQ